MADEDKKFCLECGNVLDDGVDFCLQCGAKVDDSKYDEETMEEFRRMDDMRRNGQLNMVAMLITVYAMPALIMGFIAIFNVDLFTDSFAKDEEVAKFMKDNGITYQMLHDAVFWSSYMSLGSGVCALISSVLCRLRTHWLAATILCFAAAILCVWSVFGAIIGIFVGWMLMQCKKSFESKEE